MTSMDNGDGQGRTADNDTTYCGFQVGQHVACIADHKTPGARAKWERRGVQFPARGKVYTIRALFRAENGVGVLLEEIRNPLVPSREFGKIEAYFWSSKFRPLQKLTPEQFMTTDAPVDERRAVLV